MTDCNRTFSRQKSQLPLGLGLAVRTQWTAFYSWSHPWHCSGHGWIVFRGRAGHWTGSSTTGAGWPSPADWTADGALQSPPFTIFKDQSRGRCSFPGWGRAGESKKPQRNRQPATPIKALFFLCQLSFYIYCKCVRNGPSCVLTAVLAASWLTLVS